VPDAKAKREVQVAHPDLMRQIIGDLAFIMQEVSNGAREGMFTVQGATPRLGGSGDRPPAASTRTRAVRPGVETGPHPGRAKVRTGVG
jgi:hypothetical protein